MARRVYDTKCHGRRYDGSQRGRALAVLADTSDVAQAARASGATKRTVRRWARDAGMAPVRKGGSVKNLDRRSFMRLLGGQAAMLAAAPAAAAELLGRDAYHGPTGVVRAYFVPASVYSAAAVGMLHLVGERGGLTDVARAAALAEEQTVRELLAKGPTAEPQRIMEEIRDAFDSGEVAVDWGTFKRRAYPPSAGLVVVNDTPDEVLIGATLWSTGQAQFFADGAPVELDLLTPEKARALGLQLR